MESVPVDGELDRNSVSNLSVPLCNEMNVKMLLQGEG